MYSVFIFIYLYLYVYIWALCVSWITHDSYIYIYLYIYCIYNIYMYIYIHICKLWIVPFKWQKKQTKAILYSKQSFRGIDQRGTVIGLATTSTMCTKDSASVNQVTLTKYIQTYFYYMFAVCFLSRYFVFMFFLSLFCFLFAFLYAKGKEFLRGQTL